MRFRFSRLIQGLNLNVTSLVVRFTNSYIKQCFIFQEKLSMSIILVSIDVSFQLFLITYTLHIDEAAEPL